MRANYFFLKYGKCPKILYTKVSNKMEYANSVDLDQSTLISVYTVCHSTKYLKKHLQKIQNIGKKKSMEYSVQIFGHLL